MPLFLRRKKKSYQGRLFIEHYLCISFLLEKITSEYYLSSILGFEREVFRC